MHWIAPTEKAAAAASLEKRLRDAAAHFGVPFGVPFDAHLFS